MKEELDLQRRYIFRKEKSAVEGDPEKSWSRIETEWGVGCTNQLLPQRGDAVLDPVWVGLGRNGCWPSRGSQFPRALPAFYRCNLLF